MATGVSVQSAAPSDGWAGPAAKRLPFDPSLILQQTCLLCGLFFLNKAGKPGAAVFFLILFWMAAKSTPGAFKALMLVGLGVSLNQFFVPKSVVWTPGRLALSGFCAVRCFADALGGGQRTRVSGYVWALVAFCFTSAVCSVLSGYYVHIALLKLGNFFAVTTATLLAVEVIRRRRIDMTPWFVACIGTIVAIGLVSIPLGQSTNWLRYRGLNDPGGASFNGALLHPNSHSSLAAPAFIFMVATNVYSTYRNRWICKWMAVVLAVFMVFSQARASIVASAVGLAVIILYARPTRAWHGWRLKVHVRRGTLIGVAVAAIAGLAVADVSTGGAISRKVIGFANKSTNQESLDTGQVIKSREGLIALSWENFLNSPIYGIGFQVSTQEYFKQNATLFTAPAEKGFLYTALLEEGGVLGTAAFALFFVMFVGNLMATRNVPGLAVFMTLMVATTFEVGIFAMGGSGTFFWTIAGAALMLGDHCWEKPVRAVAGSEPYSSTRLST